MSRKPSGGKPLAKDGGDEVPAFGFGLEAPANKHSKTSTSPMDPLVFSDKPGDVQVASEETNQTPSNKAKKQKLEHSDEAPSTANVSQMEKILAKLSPKAQSSGTKPSVNQEILTKLSEQQLLLEKQKSLLSGNSAALGAHPETGEVSSASSRTSGTDSLPAPVPSDDAQNIEMIELHRLRQELFDANSKIAFQEDELAQTRVMKHTLDQALGPPSESDFGGREVTEQTISQLQNAFNASNRPFSQPHDAWSDQDDSPPDICDPISAGAYNRARGFWVPPTQPALGMNANTPVADKGYGEAWSLPSSYAGQGSSKLWGNAGANPFPNSTSFQANRALSGSSFGTCGYDSRFPGDQAQCLQGPGLGPRRPVTQANRGGSCFPAQNSPWSAFGTAPSGNPIPRSPGSRPCSAYQQVGLYTAPPYHPRPIGSPLSPTATEFTSSGSNGLPWGTSSVASSVPQTYISPLEPLNYRRLLDKNVSCDWKYIVDKIVCNNDQQASIFLQQKLKVGTTEQKHDIVEAIAHQAYPLMVNRFGNFLIQRCFEHGSPDQVVVIANAIRGNTLSLSMDPFGCHVVQKAFDCVPEEHKGVMVHELLRRIPETVIHRYACHVWQKLFELRWNGDPPQIMARVNEALRGMWHEVALGETGSLVVQNIFENCLEEDKRPAIEEVIANIDALAHGQFGNWCIQHVCEHGAPHDKSRATEHILLWAVDYSMDQFASKVVEKCLKIGGPEFLDRYLGRVCTGRADRPRMPLIDVAGDQYGNYLIQWILMNGALHQRELVASHVRKHMVSLRGSKFGSRVAMLCCNPSHATRPGPGTGIPVGRFNHYNEDRYHGIPSQSSGRLSRASQWNPNYGPFR
ncbi:hypothetical protein PHISP_07020 [Aspergillus sp. HF37]|nr:hypothetical protein PHISP_07020 [Aspergillus sp. HF37]